MKTPKTAIALLSITTAILLGAWIFAIYQAFSYKKEMARASSASRESAAQSSYLSSLKSLMREEAAAIEAIESRFISESEIPDFVESLEAIAQKAELVVTIGALTLGSESSDTSIAPLSMSVSGKGSWASAIRFVSELESLPYASKIDSVSLSKVGASVAEAKDGAWNARIDLVSYVDTSKK